MKFSIAKKNILYAFNDSNGRQDVSFSQSVAAVAAVLDCRVEETPGKFSKQTLQLFGDTLCFFFDRIVESFSLYKRGLAPCCSALLERSKRILQHGVRRRNAERVCKVATSLYHHFSKVNVFSSVDRKDLRIEDFCIELMEDEQVELFPFKACSESDAFVAAGGKADACSDSENSSFREFIDSLVQTRPFGLYHRISARDGLDCTEWRSRINAIQKDTRDATQAFPNAVVCVFVDGMNTGNALGIISEAFSNHSMDGEPLLSNLFFVGAINN